MNPIHIGGDYAAPPGCSCFPPYTIRTCPLGVCATSSCDCWPALGYNGYYLAPPIIFYAEFDEHGFNTCIGRFQSAQNKVYPAEETKEQEMVRT